jgi:uncharacterized protein (TIGR02996 family)
MTDGDALYRAIVARPEDDTPRLVYADWLEENGREEEAEFTRLECRLEASTPDLPEYVELLERREELRLWLKAHAPQQTKKKLAGVSVDEGGDWWSDTCRGFPRYITCESSGGRLGVKGIRRLASTLEKAFSNLPMRFLVVDFPAIEDLAEFLKQPVVSALNGISITTNEQAGDDAARLIADCRQLSNLQGAALMFPVGEAGAVALGQSEHLARMDWLWLDTFQLAPAVIRSVGIAAWFRELRRLSLTDSLAAEAFEELCRLQPFPHLHTLNLSENGFPVSSWRAFAESKTFPKLTCLDLNRTDMSNGQMEAFAAADNLPLTRLDLARCSIGNEGLNALVAAPWVESLQWLDLTSNLLGPEAPRTIAKCKKLSNLKYFALTGNSIGGTGLKAIAGSPGLRNLTTLLLGRRAVGPRPLHSAAGHEFLEKLDMPKLRHLSLSGLAMETGTLRLLKQEKFQTLTRLDLDNCKLTDEAIPELLRSPSLQGLIELNLSGNSLKEGVLPLTERRILPRLSRCLLADNPIAPDLGRRLARRRGVIVSRK